MAYNFPSPATNGQIYEVFGKKFQFDSAIDAWKTYLVGSGSRLGDLGNVISVTPEADEFLTWDGRKWRPSGSADVGRFLTDLNFTASTTGGRFDIIDDLNASTGFNYEQKIWYDGSDIKTGSISIPINEVGYGVTASLAVLAHTASTYPGDLYLTGMSFDGTSSLHFSRSYGESTISQTLPYGKVKSVNNITGSGGLTNNIGVQIANVTTGLSSSFPASPADADVYIVAGEVAPFEDANGLIYVYAATASAWFEISAPTDADRLDRYVNKSGDTMIGAFHVTESVTPTDDLHVVTKDYVDNLAFESGSRAMQGWYMYQGTWRWIAEYYTNAQVSNTSYNETDGKITARTWNTNYEVPNNVNFMSFQCGLEQSRVNNHQMYHIVITRQSKATGQTTILAKSSAHDPLRGRQNIYTNLDPHWNANVTINTGPVNVTSGDKISMIMHGDGGSGTLALGEDKGFFFSGYVHKTANPNSLADIRTEDGLDGGGTGGALTIRVDDTVARTDRDNSFASDQVLGDVLGVSEETVLQDFTATGTSVLPGKVIMSNDIDFQLLEEYKNDAEAQAGGVIVNGLYRNGNLLMIRIS